MQVEVSIYILELNLGQGCGRRRLRSILGGTTRLTLNFATRLGSVSSFLSLFEPSESYIIIGILFFFGFIGFVQDVELVAIE